MVVPEVCPEAVNPTPWSLLVTGIAADDQSAFAELYSRLRSIYFTLWRQLGPENAEDRYHDVILAVVDGIRHRDVRDPERIVGYARTIAQRHLYEAIDDRVRHRQKVEPEQAVILRDQRPTPEADALRQERAEIAYRVLHAMSERDREVLVRFYLKEQQPEEIQRDLNLTETQFRLIKTRAKARYTKLLERRFAPRGTGSAPSHHDVPFVNPQRFAC